MNQSESIAALAAALSKAQAVLESAKKTSSNPFFKSTYADLASVWDACRKPLADNGLSIVQTADFLPDHPDMVCIETALLHSSGEWVRGRLAAKPVKADPQSVGSCITYLRRYSLQSIVGIAPEDDDGNAASGNKGEEKKEEKPKKPTPPPSPKPPVSTPAETDKSIETGSPLHKKVEATINEAGIDRELFKEWLESMGWLERKDGKLSLASFDERRAKTLLDKWESASKTFGQWVDKRNAEGEK